MGELREIVEVATIEKLFVALAVLSPLIGVLLGALWGAKRQAVARGARIGCLLGLFGTLNWLLWRVFNLLTDRNGLDTVWNVVVNLALFVGLGLALGIGIGRTLQRASGTAAETADAASTPTQPR